MIQIRTTPATLQAEGDTGTNRAGNIDFTVRTRGERRFRPGDQITGQVLAQARENFEVVFAEAILFFRTEGMGDRDEGRAAVVTLSPPGREIMRTLEASFQFTAPATPATYYGSLLKVHWMVGIYILGKGRRVHGLIEVPVIIHPTPETIELPGTVPGNFGKLVNVLPD